MARDYRSIGTPGTHFGKTRTNPWVSRTLAVHSNGNLSTGYQGAPVSIAGGLPNQTKRKNAHRHFRGGQTRFTEAFNGTKAWQWNEGDSLAKPVNKKGTAALSHGIELPGHLYTLLDMAPRGNTLEYVGDEERLNTVGHLLKLTLKDGHEKYYFLAAKTGVLLASRDQRAFHPDLDNTEVLIETRLEDFRDFQGVVKSFKSVNWDLTNDKWLATTQVLSLTYDQDIDDGYFEPEHIKPIPLDEP